jgi:hypothetical protein
METTLTRMSEDQAETIARIVKSLLLNPEQVPAFVNDPAGFPGLEQADVRAQLKDFLSRVAKSLDDEAFPWIT